MQKRKYYEFFIHFLSCARLNFKFSGILNHYPRNRCGEKVWKYNEIFSINHGLYFNPTKKLFRCFSIF